MSQLKLIITFQNAFNNSIYEGIDLEARINHVWSESTYNTFY